MTSKSMELSGALRHLDFEDTTPAIGREYINVNIVEDLINADNSDELLRDLAITISQRGVVFFRGQHNLTNELQKQLMQRLGQLSGKPPTSELHIHPLQYNNSDANEFNSVNDPQINVISSSNRSRIHKIAGAPGQPSRTEPEQPRQSPKLVQWHADIQFEPAPADYTSLRLTELPQTGGDTLWASGYELYARLSKPYQEFLCKLTATFVGEGLLRAADRIPGASIHQGPRGSPLNIGGHLQAVHPVVRTHPVTQRNSLFAAGLYARCINEVHPDESDELLRKFNAMITENHDIQVRFKWRNENDIAIWDNRCVFHTGTWDYQGLGSRTGIRAVGIGEQPYIDHP